MSSPPGTWSLITGNWRSSASKLFLVSTHVWHSCFPGPKPLDQKVCNWQNLLFPFPCIMTELHVKIGWSSVLSYSSFYFQSLNNSCGWNLSGTPASYTCKRGVPASAEAIVIDVADCFIDFMPGSGFVNFKEVWPKRLANRGRYHRPGPGLLPTGNWRSFSGARI